MAPVPEEKKKDPPPTGLAITGMAIDTVLETVGTVLGGAAFFLLMSQLWSSGRLHVSKWKAKGLKKLEKDAEEEDNKVNGNGTDSGDADGKKKRVQMNKGGRKRDVQWSY